LKIDGQQPPDHYKWLLWSWREAAKAAWRAQRLGRRAPRA
jgi:hypothetical protein